MDASRIEACVDNLQRAKRAVQAPPKVTNCKTCERFTAKESHCAWFDDEVPKEFYKEPCTHWKSADAIEKVEVLNVAIEVVQGLSPTTDCRDCQQFRKKDSFCEWYNDTVPAEFLASYCKDYQHWPLPLAPEVTGDNGAADDDDLGAVDVSDSPSAAAGS